MEVKGDPFALVFGQCTKLKVENSQPFPFTWNCKGWEFSIWELRILNLDLSILFFTHELPMDCSKLDPVLSWIISLNHMYCPDLSLKDLGSSSQRFPPKDLRSSSQSCPLICFCNIKFSYLRIKHLHFFPTQGFEIKIAQFTTERFKIFISKFSTQGIELFLSFCPT